MTSLHGFELKIDAGNELRFTANAELATLSLHTIRGIVKYVFQFGNDFLYLK